MLRRIYAAQNMMDSACQKAGRAINIMEVSGTHTVAGFRDGMRASVPRQLKLISGPGCPVCVLDPGFVDSIFRIIDSADCIIATFAELMKVRGSQKTLQQAPGEKIRIVGSSTEALALAEGTDKPVVFVSVGFSTTAATTAYALSQAKARGVKNFYVLSGHRLIVPALETMLAERNHRVDGLLCPATVGVTTGTEAFQPIVDRFNVACVIASIEPMHIIEGVAELCRQISEQSPKVVSMYGPVIKPGGNPFAKDLIDEVFVPYVGYWRGLGNIPESALRINESFAEFDAARKFDLASQPREDVTGCRCSEVLVGLIDSPQCSMFAEQCSPDHPVGPCMISADGACFAWYKYGRKKKRKEQ